MRFLSILQRSVRTGMSWDLVVGVEVDVLGVQWR